MGSAGALAWTPLFLFCPRDGRLTSKKDNIGSCGPGSAGKHRLVRAGGSASRISNTSSSTDPGGGGFAAPNKQNKPACVSPVVHPGLPCWSPSEQSYPPLGRLQATQPPELFGRAGRGTPQLAAVEAAVNDIQIVSWRGFVPSPTERSEVQEDIGKMRPAGEMNKFQKRPGRGATSGGVSVVLASNAVMPEGVDVRVLSRIAGGGGGGSSTSDDEGSVDSDVWPLRRPRPTLLGWLSADLAGAFPADLAGAYPAVAGVASPAVLAGMSVPAVAGASSLAVVEVAISTDRMEAAGSLSVCGSRSICDCLSPDGYVTDSDAVVLPDCVELGNPTDVALPTTGFVRLVAAGGQSDPDLPQDINEAIVVGVVGSGAPWFLSGWAEGTEVEFMIDTVCQVTILAMSVFKRMCASDPRVRSRLRPCGRRLILADSSPLMVRGELEMTVVFPGLSCDMVLVVASIGLEGLLGTEALQSCLPHQLDLRTGQLWVDGQSTLQLHQQRQPARASAHITCSLVLPPDSEIVAPVSIRSSSGIQLGRCSLIKPKIALTEDYGFVVSRTMVDASKWSASVLLVNITPELKWWCCHLSRALVSWCRCQRCR